MIHSRPGFMPRRTDTAPAKLQPDMVPAINRKEREQSSPLTGPSLEQMLNVRAEEHRASKPYAAPDVIVNPAPSATPTVNEPGK